MGFLGGGTWPSCLCALKKKERARAEAPVRLSPITAVSFELRGFPLVRLWIQVVLIEDIRFRKIQRLFTVHTYLLLWAPMPEKELSAPPRHISMLLNSPTPRSPYHQRYLPVHAYPL